MATNERIRRILELGQALIESRHGVVIEQYAKKRGHSRSALYRDLEVLKSLAFPIQSERGRHWLPADFQLFGRGGLDADEILHLQVARQLAGRLPGTGLDRALSSVWAKVTGTGGQPALLTASDPALSVAAFQSIDYAPHRPVIAHLEDAIHGRIAVKLRYRKPATGETTDRVVEPGELHADAAVEGLYLIAYCRWRRAVRVFAIQRIVSAEQTGERFTSRPETRSRVALRDAFRVWVGKQDAPVAVRLRFAAAVAGEIAERRWHPSQTSSRSRSGEAILDLRVADPASLIRWLMGFGADVVVESPTWLASQVRALHARAASSGPIAIGPEVRRDRPKASARRAV
ncbi:MAG TPA: transcriptional regulator [Kofleriaceae bacterium]|nr:transcriptional regulator [Kofleriaceae bacterium]